MEEFKAPSSTPQDLLLINELVGAITADTSTQSLPTTTPRISVDADDDINSSGSESEEEVAAELLEEVLPGDEAQIPSSSSDTDSSASDSEDDENGNIATLRDAEDDGDVDDFETSGPSAPPASYFKTKNEVSEVQITIPDVDNVGSDEVLEPVGDIINVMDQIAIVRGIASDIANRGSERALDSDTLLVFDDRTVLGYIYETFGPTSQPLYQVRFNSAYPLSPEKIRLDRKVFHVPQRSRFVFIDQIKAFKGSDASNVHDEEPPEDDLEFSDDEAEIAHRRMLKQRRGGSRSASVASSREPTPSPSTAYIQKFASSNPYDEYGPYDYDSAAGAPSRPMPIPYDDPYAEEYQAAEPPREAEIIPPPIKTDFSVANRPPRSSEDQPRDWNGRGRGRGGRGRGRGRGRGDMRDRSHEPVDREGGNRNRGRHNRTPYEHGRNNDGGGSRRASFDSRSHMSHPSSPHDGPPHPDVSPSTGWIPPPQPMGQPSFNFHTPLESMPISPSAQFQYPPPPFVQPHINPRFASAFGLNFPPQNQQPPMYPQNQQQPMYPQAQNSFDESYQPAMSNRYDRSGSNWADEWTVPMRDDKPPDGGGT